MATEVETIRQTYPSRTVRAAIYLYGAGREAGLQDDDIEKMLGIETEGMVRKWRERGRGGSWAGRRAWVESEVEDDEEDQPFEDKDRRKLLKSSVKVAGMLLKKCEEALEGKSIEFIKGAKPTARNVIEGLHRAHVIINKDTAQLRDIEASLTDERHAEEERIRRILRQIVRAVKWTPEQLEALRKEFPGKVPVVSEIVPRDMAKAKV